MSLIDDILKADELPAVPVDVWGITVHVATLRADERDEFEVMWQESQKERGSDDNVGIRGFLCAYCLCDENRNRLFPTSNFPAFTDAVRKISNRAAAGVTKIFNVASSINGITKSDEEELKKTSKPTTSTDGS